MDFPEKADREARRDFFKRTRNSLERADGIITISRFTKNEIIARFNVTEAKVKVICHGLDHKFWEDIAPSELEETRRKFDLSSSFILFVGALEPRKNLMKLIEALKIIHNKYKKIQLVIVGPKGEDYKNLEERIGQNRLENWVKILGYLPEKEVRNLYHLASVFAFPSLCEGFGFPLLEAMASGLPIAASSASAIPEVARDAALYFRPEDPENIAEKIVLLLKDENLRRSLQAKGKKRALDFDWKTTASETLSFYQSIFEK
jgi:glycosyltransferase involved in cell wall biosynthesis